MQNRHIKLLCALAIIGITAKAADNAHFYKAPHLYRSSTTCWFDGEQEGETRDWLTKLDVSYAYGDAGSCWNSSGDSAPLLNGAGNYNMLYLFQNVQLTPGVQNYANFLGQALNNHEAATGTFGRLSFDGKFELNDFNVNLRQNIKCGFFLEFLMPIREVKIKDITYTDLSPETGIYNKNRAEWIQFLNNIDTVLSNYGLAAHNAQYSQTSLGDISLLIGWQGVNVMEDTKTFDFLALTIKTGILFPSGDRDNENYVFSVPTGYNEHWAWQAFAQVDLGIRSWFVISAHAGIDIFFDDENMQRRMKTFDKQSGYIKLAKGEAEQDMGNIWHLGFDAKFDHFVKGLSALVGYSYTRQEDTELTPKDTIYFAKSVVNSDPILSSWYMHTLHLMLDYDFSVHMKNKKWAPRLSVFYDYPFDGKNAFKTDLIGGSLGLDIRWKI
ncbi:hypothetical protein GF322_04995 [Candidatus Dependentiae bacterium]|nr:hypothetical protein [Candidatus Dependentiae bacterium]